MYHWDPRPSEYRRQFSENLEQHTSLFVRKLQTINKDKLSMWETLIKVTYEDFVLDDDDKLYYKYLVRNFESCLADNVANIFENSFSGQVPGTKEQSNSETWLQERCFRITASVCKNVVLIGEKIKKKVDAKHQRFEWIRNHFWFPNSFKTLDMKYGIENESKAIAIYSSQTGNKVVSSGLWINAKYLHLGASPDGLILDDSTINVKGIIEVKCLKIFRGRSIEQIIQQKLPELSRQCFKVVENKILLKTSLLLLSDPAATFCYSS